MIFLVLFLVALGAAPYLLKLRLTSVMDLRPRVNSAQLRTLPGGTTRCWWFGPDKGRVVVAIHGLTTPSEAFIPLAKELDSKGIRMLAFDLYGRGLSDTPAVAQDARLFLTQLTQILQDQQVRGPVTLIGYSMGGVIASLYAARHPDLVDRLILLAPAGIDHTVSPFWRFARDVPMLGDWLVGLAGAWNLRRDIDDSSPVAPVLKAQLAREGYVTSVLASLRGVLSMRLAETHRKLATDGTPVLAIWGRQDRVIPASAIGSLAHWNRSVTHEVIEGADHALPITHAPDIARLIAGFLAETREPVCRSNRLSP